MRFISILSIVLVGVLILSCSCKFHVCIEADAKSACDQCKKKPTISYRPQDHKSSGIKVLEKKFKVLC